MKHRIGTVTAGLMIAVAVLADGIQFLLTLTVIGSIVSMFVSAFVWMVFVLWFALLGVSYFDRGAARQGLILLASVIVELLPMVNALPAVTAGVVALIISTRIEDKKRMEATSSAPNVRAAAASARRREAINSARAAREARTQQEREAAE